MQGLSSPAWASWALASRLLALGLTLVLGAASRPFHDLHASLAPLEFLLPIDWQLPALLGL